MGMIGTDNTSVHEGRDNGGHGVESGDWVMRARKTRIAK
jgi:hypothetical protein